MTVKRIRELVLPQICLLVTELHRAYIHLERPGNTVRVMFFDFSIAFNTIQSLLLVKKLSAMRVVNDMVAWIGDYRSRRPQYMRLQRGMSNVVMSNTGATFRSSQMTPPSCAASVRTSSTEVWWMASSDGPKRTTSSST